MRWPIVAPGRVGPPYLDEGDAVCLADRHGIPVGEWVTVAATTTAVRLRVPDDAGPVKCWLARDDRGRLAWWSEATWQPAALPGQWVYLPLRRDWPQIVSPPVPPEARMPATDEAPAKTRPQLQPGPRPGPPRHSLRSPIAEPAPVIRWSSK